MEGRRFVAGNALVSLSEENLVDCDNRSGTPRGTDMGCNGGLMDSAFDWTKKNGGLCSEGDYPYKAGGGKEGTCNTGCTKVDNSAPLSFTDIKANSNDAMMSALDNGPVSVAIQANTKEFQLYKSGVFSSPCGTDLDHGVLCTGYGVDGNAKFYNVKNSWGTGWGENGYIRFAKESSIDTTQPAGQCGILAQASYPTHGKK
jgi:C1A family cysteine protease